MNILSIGNSFSQDAQRYLHRIARADGVELNTVNLYIGGCPLSKHYQNMLLDSRAYELEVNGERTGFFVTMKEALLNRPWDVVTLQQVSSRSPDYETYSPYLEELAAYVRKCVPKAKIAIHQTWAYEQASKRLCEELGYQDQADMFRDIKIAYEKAAAAIGADLLIPAGEVFQELIAAGQTVHRDTFHASFGLGRFTLGLLWYGILTGRDVAGNTFADLDEDVTSEQIALAEACAEKVIKRHCE